MTTHRVTQERVGTERRWLCPCGFATPWTTYTSATDAAEAIRHELEHRDSPALPGETNGPPQQSQGGPSIHRNDRSTT